MSACMVTCVNNPINVPEDVNLCVMHLHIPLFCALWGYLGIYVNMCGVVCWSPKEFPPSLFHTWVFVYSLQVGALGVKSLSVELMCRHALLCRPVSVCVCVCVWEREREREREHQSSKTNSFCLPAATHLPPRTTATGPATCSSRLMLLVLLS